MRAEFHRTDSRGGYAVLIRRDDGLTVRLPGYDRRWRVPHDMAHLVAEYEFRLGRGVFGSIAAGALFSNMSIVAGRARFDARARSRAVLRANAAEIGLAECVAGVVHDAVEHNLAPADAHRRLTEVWGVLRPGACPYNLAVLRHAMDSLAAAEARWRTVQPGGSLVMHWGPPVAGRGVPERPKSQPGHPGAGRPRSGRSRSGQPQFGWPQVKRSLFLWSRSWEAPSGQAPVSQPPPHPAQPEKRRFRNSRFTSA